jgi:pimeloyl-ACP methyl ester carboxylesterase
MPMVQYVELTIDLTGTMGLGVPAHVAATVVLPEAKSLPQRPVVCFAKPGGGYSRRYFTHDLPGPARGSQAAHHAAHGMIMVALDLLGSGESSTHEASELSFRSVTKASHQAEREILLRLENGVLAPGYPPIVSPVTLGIGHATGAALTIVQQSRHGFYDALAVLGFSGFHNHPSTPPGEAPIITPWFARDALSDDTDGLVNAAALNGIAADQPATSEWSALAWSFYYDDVPREVVKRDLKHFDIVAGDRGAGQQGLSPWHSPCVSSAITSSIFTPGAVAAEAAAVTVPVLSAVGERDIIVDLLGEARAYRSAPSFDLFVCPRMGHMHNFAGTRDLLWDRIACFGDWARRWRSRRKP